MDASTVDSDDEVVLAQVIDLTRSSAAEKDKARPEKAKSTTPRKRTTRDRTAWELCEKQDDY